MFACIHAPGNLAALLDCAQQFSPLVEETTPDDVIFDVRGLRLIFGAPKHIAAEIYRRLGVPGNVVIASNPDAAFFAARGIAGVTVIDPGREAAVLAPLPLYLLDGSLLGGSPELAHTLDLWGIRTLGEFAALPAAGIAARLGEEGVQMQRLARGSAIRQLRVRVDALEFREEFEPEATVDLLEPLLLLCGRMMNDVCTRMERQSLATNEIRVTLKLEHAPDHSVILSLPVPMIDCKVFLKLLQLELNERPPQAGVEKISIEMIPVEPRRMQHGLFQPPSPEPEKLEITLARIRALVGAENVGAAEVLDTHRADSFRIGRLKQDPMWGRHPAGKPASSRLEVFSKPQSSSRHGCQLAGKMPAPQLALRRFRPPCAAQVWCSRSGQPVRIQSSKGDWRVEACAGPWMGSGDWWSDPWDSEEWDVEINSDGVYRIHQNQRLRKWFVDGQYD
jgi:protein ImuB